MPALRTNHRPLPILLHVFFHVGFPIKRFLPAARVYRVQRFFSIALSRSIPGFVHARREQGFLGQRRHGQISFGKRSKILWEHLLHPIVKGQSTHDPHRIIPASHVLPYHISPKLRYHDVCCKRLAKTCQALISCLAKIYADSLLGQNSVWLGLPFAISRPAQALVAPPALPCCTVR